jgi:hypothetical protein
MRADGRTTSQHLTAEFFMQIFDQGASNMLFAWSADTMRQKMFQVIAAWYMQESLP